MTKLRISVNWFENGEPKERGFRVSYADTWHARVRKHELIAEKKADQSEGVTVYSTSLDGETTEGFWTWDEGKQAYDYYELG